MTNHTPHTISIPSELWDWATDKCEESNQGPASFLRNVLIGAMRRGGATPSSVARAAAASSLGVPNVADRRKERGKAVHDKCYSAMVDRFTGDEMPTATAWTAERSTICPKCSKAIHPGDEIVITAISEWAS